VSQGIWTTGILITTKDTSLARKCLDLTVETFEKRNSELQHAIGVDLRKIHEFEDVVYSFFESSMRAYSN
ncbi:MAG: hypothetical protein ACFFB3_16360, partial [Candidatus Hodarchaeota archaeon]